MFQPIISNLKLVSNPTLAKNPAIELKLDEFISSVNKGGYYSYNGSLTTPSMISCFVMISLQLNYMIFVVYIDFLYINASKFSRLQSSCQLASLRTDNKHIREAGMTLDCMNYFYNSGFNHFGYYFMFWFNTFSNENSNNNNNDSKSIIIYKFSNNGSIDVKTIFYFRLKLSGLN